MNSNNPNFDFGDRELEVSEILLDLPYLFTNSLSDIRFPNSWTSKRRRSVPNDSPAPESANLPSPPPPPVKIVPPPTCEAVSPNTPLSYCPSESEGKSKHQSTTRKTSVKRTREELLRVIEEKTQNYQILTMEISKVKLHLQKLEDENSELRAKKQKLEEVRTKLEACDGLYPQQLNYYSIHSGPSTPTVHHYHLPLFLPHPTVQMEQKLGPLGFDLNVPAAEETERPVQLQPSDYQQTFIMSMMSRRAYTEQARAARHHRTKLNKAKRLQRGR